MAFSKTSTAFAAASSSSAASASNDFTMKQQRRVLPISRKGGDDKEWPRDAGGS